MSRCLVTGGAGFIGSHVVELLLDEGHEVLVVDNYSTGNHRHKNATEIHTDIQSLHTLRGAEYVFQLASLARIQPSIADPVKAHDTNVNGTLNILELCRKEGAKLIFSSSSSIYAGDDLPTHENATKDPKSPYALQKLICEQYIELYSKLYGLEYSILRYFNVYGERQILRGTYAAVVGIFLEQHSKGEPLVITGDGEQRRDFTYVRDVARANLMAMDWEGTFNIGTGKNYSINEIASMISNKKTYIKPRPGEAKATLADSSRARSKGWKPTMDIKEWIDAYLGR